MEKINETEELKLDINKMNGTNETAKEIAYLKKDKEDFSEVKYGPEILRSEMVRVMDDTFYTLEKELPECMCEKEAYIVDFLREKIAPMVTGVTEEKMFFDDRLKMILEECESPIEKLLAIGFKSIGLESYKRSPIIESIEISNQRTILCRNLKYRVDFLITVRDSIDRFKMYVVECDGHEFHEKTKEQVIYDNERTRDLQRAGYEVIRFSGTEIWNRPHKCAMEVLRIIFSQCEDIGLLGK